MNELAHGNSALEGNIRSIDAADYLAHVSLPNSLYPEKENVGMAAPSSPNVRKIAEKGVLRKSIRGWCLLVTAAFIPGAFAPIFIPIFRGMDHGEACIFRIGFLAAVYFSYASILSFPVMTKSRKEALVLAYWHLGYLCIMFGGIWLILPQALLSPRLTMLQTPVPSVPAPWEIPGVAFLFDGAFLLTIGLGLFRKTLAACSTNSFQHFRRWGRMGIGIFACCVAPLIVVIILDRGPAAAIWISLSLAIICMLHYMVFYFSRRCAKSLLERPVRGYRA